MSIPYILLGDPTRLAALTEDQREDVSQRLGQVNDILTGLLADINAWLPPEPAPEPEPSPAPQPDPEPVTRCGWCDRPATGVARMGVVGIDLGLRPACADCQKENTP